MRSLLLTTAAVLFTATTAMAQTTTSPAPNGAPNAPVVTAPGASPGNTGSTAGSMSAPSMGTPAGTPAPTGAPDAAQVTQPGASPGNMAPATPPSTMTAPTPPPMPMSPATPMKPMKPMKKSSMGMGHMMAMPEDADTMTYLHIASMAIKHGNKAMAQDALGRAETRELTRAVPQSPMIPRDSSPIVSMIEDASTAVSDGNMKMAMSDTKHAMQMLHGK